MSRALPLTLAFVGAPILAMTACDSGAVSADAGPDAAPLPDAASPRVALGSGAVTYEPLVDGGEIQIVQGPQGGYHFFGSARVWGIEPGDWENINDPVNPTTAFQAFRDTERLDIGAASYTQGLEPNDVPGAWDMPGRLVILKITDDDQLAGSEVRFEVTVTGADGTMVFDERTLIAVPHPNNL